MMDNKLNRESRIESESIIHAVGESNPLNTDQSVKLPLPTQTTSLDILDNSEPVLWQFDEEIGLPVVSSMEYFAEMYGMYGQPDMHENGKSVTLPMKYTQHAHNGGHSQVNLTREDTLGFFAPESRIWNEFPRLYVGTPDHYQHLTQNCTQIIWSEPHERPILTPGQQRRVREVCIVPPDEAPFRLTRSVSKGWVRLEKLLSQDQNPHSSTLSSTIAGDD